MVETEPRTDDIPADSPDIGKSIITEHSRKYLIYLFAGISLILLAGAMIGAAPDSLSTAINPVDAGHDQNIAHGTYQMPGELEAEGERFELNNSDYLNVTLESSEPVKLVLESVPEMVTMHISSASGAISTLITLRGFLPLTTYHRYEDDYHNHTTFMTDEGGGYTYTQDIFSPHLIFIQPRASTKFINDSATGGDCYKIGTWNAAVRTCTLTIDLTETIQIDNDSITLNGSGHYITGSGTGNGIYLSGRSNVVIKNLNVRNFSNGIFLGYSIYINLTGNNAYNNGNGIYLYKSSNNNLTGNNAYNNGDGIRLYANKNNITGNNISNNRNGIYVDYSSNNTIYNNYFLNSINLMFDGPIINYWNIKITKSKNIIGGPYLGGNFWAYPNGTGFSQTCVDANRDGICDSKYVLNSNNTDYLPLTEPCTTISMPGNYKLTADIINSTDNNCIKIVSDDVVFDGQGHTIDGSDIYNSHGVYVYNSSRPLRNVTVRNLSVTDWDYGIRYFSANNGSIENITASSNNNGISLEYGNNNVIENNNISSNSDTGISVYNSSDNDLTNNIFSNNSRGIYLGSSSYNIMDGNEISNNSMHGIIFVKIRYSNFTATSNNITNNMIHDNGGDGIHFEGEDNSLIAGNLIRSNMQGIYLGIRSSYSVNNTITNNFIENNIETGIYILESYDNLIYDNVFNNTINAIDTYYNPIVAPTPGAWAPPGALAIEVTDYQFVNYWNISKTNMSNIVGGYYQGGNFWSDYAGEDTDGDYLGDTELPYISGEMISKGGDYHPLIPPEIACGAKIISDTVMKNDVLNCRATGIEIASDDIALDCGGHTLSGYQGSNFGIYVNGRRNATIRNCSIKDFYTGIFAFNSTFVNLTNNDLKNNYIGFLSQEARRSTVLNNRISSNTLNGVRLISSSDNFINSNILEGNGLGLYFSDPVSYYNIIQNNLVNGELYYHIVNVSGITLQNKALSAPGVSNLGKITLINSSHITLNNLTLVNNGGSGSGLFLYRADNNTLTDIIASDNEYGIRLESSRNNSMRTKAFRNNYGIFLNLSSGNWIAGSNTSGNYHGLHLDASSQNTLTDVHAGNNYIGIFLSSSNRNALRSIRSFDNFNGMFVNISSGNDISALNASNNRIGIRFDKSSMNRISDSSITASDQYGIFYSGHSLNDISNITMNENRVSLTGYDISLRDVPVPPPEDTRGWIYGIGRYLDVGNNSNDSWVLLNMSYAASDLGQVRKSSLGIHRFDRLKADWNLVQGSKVFTDRDYVSANISSSFGIFGLSGVIRPTRVVFKNIPCITGDAFYTLIREAVAASGNGERIVVCPGNYTETTVTVDKTLDIQSYTGVNETFIVAVTGDILKVTASRVNITGFTFRNAKDPGAAAIRISGSNGTISGNAIDSNYNGINSTGSYNSIHNNSIVRNTNAGIELRSGSHHNSVTGNTIIANPKGLLGSSSSDNVVMKNSIAGSDRGIYLVSSNRNSVKENVIYSNNNGIHLYSSSYNKMIENTLYSHNISGIKLEQSSNGNILSNNSILWSKEAGISFDNSMNNEISHNRLETGSYGIYIDVSTNSLISYNNILNNSEEGIYAENSQRLNISNNRVTSSDRGIHLYLSGWNDINNNVATANSNSSIRLTESTGNVISRNIVSFAKHGIYLDNSSSNRIENNNAFLNYQGGITVTFGSNNNTISHNDIKQNIVDGIYVQKSDSNNISINTVESQNEFGITLDSSKNSMISDNFVRNNTLGGIYLNTSADRNVIRNNTIQDNRNQGLIINRSYFNQIYKNNFLSNSNSTRCRAGSTCQAFDNGNNTWNTSTAGNHWSDYDEPGDGCNDRNADGFCDHPYTNITDGTDWHPYTSFIGKYSVNLKVVYLTNETVRIDAQMVDTKGNKIKIGGKQVTFAQIGKTGRSPALGYSTEGTRTAGASAMEQMGTFTDVVTKTNEVGLASTVYTFKGTDALAMVKILVDMEGIRSEIDIPSFYEFPTIFLVTPKYQRYFLQGLDQKNELKIYNDWGIMLLPEKIVLEQLNISTIPSQEIYSETKPLESVTVGGINYPRSSITTKEFQMGSLPVGANPMTITSVSDLGSSSSIQNVYWTIMKGNKALEGLGGLRELKRSDNNIGWINGADYAEYSSDLRLNTKIIDQLVKKTISAVVEEVTGVPIPVDKIDNTIKMIKDVFKNTRDVENKDYARIARDIGDGLVGLNVITESQKENVISQLTEGNYLDIRTLDWIINNDVISYSEKFLGYVPSFDVPDYVPYVGGSYGVDLNSIELYDLAEYETRDGSALTTSGGNITIRLGQAVGDVKLDISGTNTYGPQASQLELIQKRYDFQIRGKVPVIKYDFGVAKIGVAIEYQGILYIVFVPVGETAVFDLGGVDIEITALLNGKINIVIASAEVTLGAGMGIGAEVSRARGFEMTSLRGIVIVRLDWQLLFYKDHWGRKFICDIWPALEGGDVKCWDEKASEPEGWRLMDRGYVTENYAKFAGYQGEQALLIQHAGAAMNFAEYAALQGSASPTTETLLIENVFPEAEPRLALNRDNNNMMMVYVHDDITKEITQAFEIYYTRWNGSQWSLPSAITSDLRPDVKPDAVYDTNGNAFAVWVTVNNSALTNTTPLNETIKYAEIAYSKFDTSTNEWTEPELLTHNQFFDYDPLLASGQNGKIMAMWYADEDNQLSIGGNASMPHDMNKTIYYSVWNGSSWRPPAVAFSNIPLSNRMEFAFNGDQATAVWGQDTDGNSSTLDDREVMYSTWNGIWTAPSRITDNYFEDRLPTVIYDGTGTLLAWESIETTSKNVTVNNTNKTVNESQFKIYYSTFNGIWSEPDLLTETRQVEQLILTRNPQDHPVLLWQTTSDEGTDIFYSIFDKRHHTWGAENQLTSDTSTDISYSPVITSSNDIISSYVKAEVKLINETVNVSKETFNVTVTKTGNSSIYILTHHIFVDLEIGDRDIMLSDPNPAPGEIVAINATVRNVGDLTLDDIRVRFIEGYSGSEIGTRMIDSIGAWKNGTVSVMWRIPESNRSQDVYVDIDPLNDIAEQNETNNKAMITTNLPDIVIGAGYAGYISGKDVLINATIRNIGHSSAMNIPVSFYYSDTLSFNNINKTLIKTVNISDIEPGSFENVSIVWNPSFLRAGYYYMFVVADPDNKILETDETNNEKMLILKSFQDIAVGDIVFNDVMEGNIKFNLTVSNQGSFDASDVNLKVFRALPFIVNKTNNSFEIELNESLIILNVTKPLIRVNENMTISGTWDASPGNHEIYAIADPYDLIRERDEFNNIGSIRLRILQRLNLTYLDAVDTDADGLFDHIRAEVSASIEEAGNYYLTGLLNGKINLNSSNLVYLEPGEQSISINFSGIEIREKGLNGPFALKNVSLYDETGIMGRLEGQYNTTPLDPANFQRSPINLTGQFSDSGIDTDGDSLFNYLAVYAGVNVTKAGTYIVHGSLYDPQGNFTASVYNTTFLDVGTLSVILRFDGITIRGRGIDGPYILGSLTVYDQNQDVLIDEADLYSTKFYNYTDFQGVNITGRPPVADCGADKSMCENVGSPVHFNGSASYDIDCSIVSYEWEFGDGYSYKGLDYVPAHTYSLYRWNGTAYQPFIVNLTVMDNDDLTNSTSQKVIIWMAGDANGDGKVNILDASVVGLKWGSSDPCADLNNDGKVNIIDASIIGLNWGKSAQVLPIAAMTYDFFYQYNNIENAKKYNDL